MTKTAAVALTSSPYSYLKLNRRLLNEELSSYSPAPHYIHPAVYMKMDINDSHCFPLLLLPFFFGSLIASSRELLPPPSHTQKAEPCLNPAALINLTDFVNYLFGWLTASLFLCVCARPSLKYLGRMPQLRIA